MRKKCFNLLLSAAVLLACLGVAGAQPPKIDAATPPNSTIVFGGSVSAFGTLELNDGSTVAFAPSLLNVTITCDKLIVNGNAEIDLTRHVAVPELRRNPERLARRGMTMLLKMAVPVRQEEQAQREQTESIWHSRRRVRM